MKSLEKRLEKIEQRTSQKNRSFHVAIIETDGSVTVRRPNHEGSFQLPNEKALEQWVTNNQVSKDDYLKVIIVNPEGKPPMEF